MSLASAGSDVLSQLDRFKESFLWAAAKGGRVEECESLVQMGTDVNWVSPEGDTPLLAACRNGHVGAALYLLDHGANVKRATEEGHTALHLSCQQGNEAVAEALILRGADVLARDKGGLTAFERQGPHAPSGMLRRLKLISQRNQGDIGNIIIGSTNGSDGETTLIADATLAATTGEETNSGNGAPGITTHLTSIDRLYGVQPGAILLPNDSIGATSTSSHTFGCGTAAEAIARARPGGSGHDWLHQDCVHHDRPSNSAAERGILGDRAIGIGGGGGGRGRERESVGQEGSQSRGQRQGEMTEGEGDEGGEGGEHRTGLPRTRILRGIRGNVSGQDRERGTEVLTERGGARGRHADRVDNDSTEGLHDSHNRDERRTTFPCISPHAAASPAEGTTTSQRSQSGRASSSRRSGTHRVIATPAHPATAGVRSVTTPPITFSGAIENDPSLNGFSQAERSTAGREATATTYPIRNTAGQASRSSGEEFRSISAHDDQDDDDNGILDEEDIRSIRLLSGVYRGRNRRQRSLPVRRSPESHDTRSPEVTRLMSAGFPVQHASAAIAAAIASAASPVDTDSAPYPSMTAGPPPDTLESSSQRSFDVTSSAWGDTSYGGGNGGGSTSGRHGESNEVGPAEEASLAQDDEERRRLSSDEGEGSRGGAGAAQDFEAGWERRGEEGEAGRVSRFEVGDTPRLSMTPTYVGEAQDNGDRHGDGVALGSESRGSTEHVGLIRMLWLQEKEGRLAAEAKADAVRDQSARLWNELVRSEKQVLSLEETAAASRQETDKLRATLRGDGFKGRSLQELEQLDKDLRKALEAVSGERDRIAQEQLAKEEQRLCVVCQANERSVLLLPCRHLCVCRGCSKRRELISCPLCRNDIAETLVVYS